MSKYLQLSIADPCHENWDNMTNAEKGRFCGSCQKRVIDFSGMSDREIAQFFKKPSTGSVCGRFMQDQLDRSIEIPKKRIPWVKYFFQFALPAFLMSLKASAQKEGQLMGKVSPVCMQQIPVNSLPIRIESSNKDSTVIKGNIVDEKGEPISFASVQIKGTKKGVATDENGAFSIGLVQGLKDLILIASAVGFESKEMTCSPDEYQRIILPISLNTMLGEVVVATNISERLLNVRMGGLGSVISTSNTQAVIKSLFRIDSVKIYPNPALSGGTINVEILKFGQGKTLIELYNMAGQAVYSNEINMSNKSWKAILPLPSLLPGSYILKVYSDKNKIFYSTKMIIR